MRSSIVLLLIYIVTISMFSQPIFAKDSLRELQNGDLKIMLLYSNDSSELSPNVRKLDLALHHFTSEVQVKSVHDIDKANFTWANHIVYYGEHAAEIEEDIVKQINDFSGSTIFIGENAEQFASMETLITGRKVKVNKLGLTQSNDSSVIRRLVAINEIKDSKELEVILYGANNSNQFPLLVKSDKDYYFAINNFDKEEYYLFSDSLHDVLPNDHLNSHVAYLRLEDIHPMSDPDKLLAVGEYLNERGIPYLLAVIPVHITPETGKRTYFSNVPKLLEVLQYLQSTGGTVIAHGYTHQYRDSEVGEGFEFWDVENEQFIIESNPNNEIEEVLTQSDFTNKKEYEVYITDLRDREREYTTERMEHAIHELVSHELYPLAFEAPHYTMSQAGYSIVGDYYSSVFGQIQLSDDIWELMGTPPFLSTSTFLRGMTLYPETIGYIDPGASRPFKSVSLSITDALYVRDSMIGGFYHPYLDVEYLPGLLAEYEKIPHFTWLNFKETEQVVETSKMTIKSDGTGNMEIINTMTWFQKIWDNPNTSSFEKILWIVSIVVILFIFLFLIITLYLRRRLSKDLFKERRYHG